MNPDSRCIGFGLLALLATGAVPLRGHAAACCAGSSAMPGLITGDQAAQVSLTALSSEEVALAGSDGTVTETPIDLRQRTTRVRIDASTLISDLWQVGAGTNWVTRPTPTVFGDEPAAALLGDTTLNVSYEALPEFGYSHWTPRGWIFAQLTIPTGRSIHEARSFALNDVSGQGVYALSVGASFTKNRGLFDAYANPMFQWSFGRDLAATSLNGDVSLGAAWGMSVLTGIGVNPGSGTFRMGARMLASFTSGRSIASGGIQSRSDGQWLVEPALEASALISNAWTLAVSASDNRLFGLNHNVAVTRGVSFSVVHRWER